MPVDYSKMSGKQLDKIDSTKLKGADASAYNKAWAKADAKAAPKVGNAQMAKDKAWEATQAKKNKK